MSDDNGVLDESELDDDLQINPDSDPDGNTDAESPADGQSVDVGAGVQAATIGSLAWLSAIVMVPLGILPSAWRIWHTLHKFATYQMQKAASADAIADVRRSSSREDFLPAAYVEGAEDEKERSGWKVKGIDGKRYAPPLGGEGPLRYGKANILKINEDDTETGTWTEAALRAALKADRERYLFRDAQLVADGVYLADDAAGDIPARADGGRRPNVQELGRVSVHSPGVAEDILVPAQSEPGFDGQVLSLNKFSNLKREQGDQETVRDAKNSAWAAAKLDDIGAADYLKWGLIFVGWSALLLFKDAIASFISGLAGSGGAGGAVGGAVSGGIGSVAPLAVDLAVGVM